MNILRSHWQGLAWAAVFGMCLPPSMVVGREASAPPPPMIHDVALAPGGLLVGQVLDHSMQPIAGAPVEIQVAGQTTATTTTDEMGVFAVTGLRGGVHQVVTQHAIENCRLWAPETAPPHAAQSLRFVPGQGEAIRGQWGSHHHKEPFTSRAVSFATNPWVIGGVIATAIAVPIVIHNLDRDKEPTS